jgi:hypothetical protein
VTTTLTTDELLVGGAGRHEVEIPPEVLLPADGDRPDDAPARVVIRPLVLADVQQIERAGREGQALTSVLMVQQALVEPRLTVEQVGRMHAGLVEFLLAEVNRVSGLSVSRDELADAVQAPLARACFVLAREFGWTPEQCAGLTLGQVLLYVEMLGRGQRPGEPPE